MAIPQTDLANDFRRYRWSCVLDGKVADSVPLGVYHAPQVLLSLRGVRMRRSRPYQSHRQVPKAS